jgi:hypothetical protein
MAVPWKQARRSPTTPFYPGAGLINPLGRIGSALVLGRDFNSNEVPPPRNCRDISVPPNAYQACQTIEPGSQMHMPAKRPILPSWLAAVPLILNAGVVSLGFSAADANARMHEATAFSVPAGSPDEYMQAGAQFARSLEPDVEISFQESQSGSLSVSRVEAGGVKCIVRASPDIADALRPLGRFLNGRVEPRAQAMFALAHEVGHCKLRDAFLNRSDGRVADPSVFPWLAQEAAADAYGILSVERRLGPDAPVRQAVILSRMLSSSLYRDPNHATGHYVSDALALCHQNRTDADAVRCAIATAYYTVGSLANTEQGSPYPVDSAPELLYQLGVQEVSKAMHVYPDLEQYKAQFSGADLSRFAFSEVSRDGESRYITAATGQNTDTTHGLADYYGFKTGELVTDDRRKLTALRIDGPDELDWLLTLGAVVRTEDGKALRKGDVQH